MSEVTQKKRKFIINKDSGKGLGRAQIDDIAHYFRKATGSFDYVIPKSREETVAATQSSLREGYEQIVAIGGDGTLNAVVNGFFVNGSLINPEASLALAKAGTGCDYFRTVFDGSKTDWRHAVLEHRTVAVDVGQIGFSSVGVRGQCNVQRYFLNMASVGVIANIVDIKNKMPRRSPSLMKYLVPTIAGLAKYRPLEVHIEMDNGVKLKEKVITVTAAKGVFAGGGMRFGGGVSLVDGLFDVTVFCAMPFTRLFSSLGRLYSGSYDGVAGITKYKTAHLILRSTAKAQVEFDGEVVADGEVEGLTDVELVVLPRLLRICKP